MKKKVLAYCSFLVFGITLAYQINVRLSMSSIAVCNIEALSLSPEASGTFYCEGNKSTCAKGIDENTGKELIIHGKLTKAK